MIGNLQVNQCLLKCGLRHTAAPGALRTLAATATEETAERPQMLKLYQLIGSSADNIPRDDKAHQNAALKNQWLGRFFKKARIMPQRERILERIRSRVALHDTFWRELKAIQPLYMTARALGWGLFKLRATRFAPQGPSTHCHQFATELRLIADAHAWNAAIRATGKTFLEGVYNM